MKRDIVKRGKRGSCSDEGERDARGMESPSASDGFELGKVQAAQKRHPSEPTPLSFRLATPLRDSPCSPSLELLSLFLALFPSPLSPLSSPFSAACLFARGSLSTHPSSVPSAPSPFYHCFTARRNILVTTMTQCEELDLFLIV